METFHVQYHFHRCDTNYVPYQHILVMYRYINDIMTQVQMCTLSDN